MGDYIITGLTKEHGRCLVYVLGRTTEDMAKKMLEEFINNPTDNEKKLQKDHTDFQIEYVELDECWWRGNCD